MEKKKSQRHSHRDNQATEKNIESDKFLRKNEEIPTSKFNEEIPSDTLGSYTGVPENENEQPVQDADDL